VEVLPKYENEAGALSGDMTLHAGRKWRLLDKLSASVSAAAVFIGGGFAFMHSTLQTWATEVVPEARATVISFFAAALFAGSGLAAMAAARLRRPVPMTCSSR
jgi:hypothetical protein